MGQFYHLLEVDFRQNDCSGMEELFLLDSCGLPIPDSWGHCCCCCCTHFYGFIVFVVVVFAIIVVVVAAAAAAATIVVRGGGVGFCWWCW